MKSSRKSADNNNIDNMKKAIIALTALAATSLWADDDTVYDKAYVGAHLSVQKIRREPDRRRRALSL